ncbi:hypothetical protein BD408DRAFT_426142 [Parasitella parasitica]|nr:hypothetical protein BD408DRAFT_426142 [Parasitella parasitica]
MSSSGLIAARKRLENALKRYDIPTESEPKQVSKCEDGVLLLSLLQSRLNWTNATFARYKTDPIQQPKRTSNTRRKWPNMKYLGTCTLQLGAHLYENTNFFEATRSDSWKDIAIKQGLMKPPIIPVADVTKDNKLESDPMPDLVTTETEKNAPIAPKEAQDVVMEEADKPVNTVSEQNTTTEVEKRKPTEQTQIQAEPNTKEDPVLETQTNVGNTSAVREVPTTNVESQSSTSSEPQQTNTFNVTESELPQPQPQPQPQPEEAPDEKLKFVDIVFELKEFPNERFIFPKEAIIQTTLTGPNPEDCLIIASFVLPLDLTQTEEFFQKPKEKILKYGDTCQLPCIKDYYNQNTTRETRTTADTSLTLDSYQPVNIRMTCAHITTANALKEYVHKTEIVRKNMKDKLKFFPKRKFLKFDVSDDPTRQNEIRELIKRASVALDISTGPVQAEKKRNEILNAIRLGKRERDEKFESELPKHKLNARDDGFMKCAYCSTKQTSMWRAGPGGHGTLCNSCGIQWNRGEILVDAPVISKEEEKRLWKERKEKERIAEALELEKAEKEEERLKKKIKHHHSGGSSSHHQDFSYNSSTFAAQLLQKRHLQKQANLPPGTTTVAVASTSAASATNNPLSANPSVVIAQQSKPEAKKALPSKSKMNQAKATESNVPTTTSASPLPSSTANHAPAVIIAQQPGQAQAPPQTQQQAAAPVPLSLYSPAGIPLPTLSIDFAGHLQFAHPNCGITLLDRHFSVRLFKDGCDQTTIEFDKKDLTNAIFEVVTEGEAALKREVLKMKIVPADVKKIAAFGKNMKIDKKHGVNIRFLEKLDPSGGAVVQRILQRWLVTAPQ